MNNLTKTLLLTLIIFSFSACDVESEIEDAINDLNPIELSFLSESVTFQEENGLQNIEIELGISSPISTSIGVNISGTASYGSDYTTNLVEDNGEYSLDIAFGEDSKTISLTIIEDEEVEGDETIILTLSSDISGVDLGDIGSMTVTIADND